jgi:hypothetical protein
MMSQFLTRDGLLPLTLRPPLTTQPSRRFLPFAVFASLSKALKDHSVKIGVGVAGAAVAGYIVYKVRVAWLVLGVASLGSCDFCGYPSRS